MCIRDSYWNVAGGPDTQWVFVQLKYAANLNDLPEGGQYNSVGSKIRPANSRLAWGIKIANYWGTMFTSTKAALETINSTTYTLSQLDTRQNGVSAFIDDGDTASSSNGFTPEEWTAAASFFPFDFAEVGTDPGIVDESNASVGGMITDTYPDFRVTFDTISHYEDDIRLTPYTKLDGRDISVDGTFVDIVSAKHDDWTSTFTQVQSLSDGWNTGATIDTIMQNNSANWNSTHTTVSDSSANWTGVYTEVSETSGNWDSTYTTLNTNSAHWLDTRAGLEQTYEGDLLTITNKVSATEAYVKSLTAEQTTYLDVASGLTLPVGKSIYVRDGILDVDGDIRVRDGDLKVSESIVHYLDENTEIRFEPDRLTFRCHDIRFFTINEDPGADEDYISIGGEADGNRIDFKMYAADISEPLVIEARGDTGLVSFGYSTELGTDSTNNVTFNAEVDSDVIPDEAAGLTNDVTVHNLGSDSKAWSAIYVKDLQFKDTARKDSSVSPLTATGDYIVVTVDGVQKAIRLWDF